MATARGGLRVVIKEDSSVIRSSWLVGRWKEADVEGLLYCGVVEVSWPVWEEEPVVFLRWRPAASE